VVLVPHYSQKNQMLPSGGNLPAVWETLIYLVLLRFTPTSSGVIDRVDRSANLPPGKRNVKTGPLFRYLIFVCFSVRFVVIFAFFGSFSVISIFSITIHTRIHYHFACFFWVLASEPPSAMFCPWLKPPFIATAN